MPKGITRIPIVSRYPVTSEGLDTTPEDTEGDVSELVGEARDDTTPAMPGRTTSIKDAYAVRFASIWALRYKTIKGHPLTFESSDPYKHRPWQRAIMDDNHPNKVVEKSRQLGLSETSITEAIHFLATHHQTNVMYTFPTYPQMNDFSVTRVLPVFRNNLHLSSLLSREVNNITTKRIGDSNLFMRSASSGSIGEGVDADCAYFDEYDRMREGVELAFQEGLSSSPYGLIRKFSTPTIPGRGINYQYSRSDQMRYIHICPHCGERQFLTFEDNIIQVDPNGVDPHTNEVRDGTFIVGCRKCGRPLDRMATGEWVPMYPSVHETRGYHISQLDAAWISADSIMRRKLSYRSKQLFYNYVVGEPYANEGLLVTDQDIQAAVRLPGETMSRTSRYVAVVAGIDWGDVSYMVVLGIKSNGALDLLNLYSVRNEQGRPLTDVTYLCAVLRAYAPNIVVADAGYGADKNSYGFTQYPAAWYSCHWTTSKDAGSKVRFKDQYNETSHEILVDKTVSVQRTIYSLKGQLISLFPWGEKIATLALHARNTRIMEEEDDGRVYQKATRVGPDHYISALSYALIGVNKVTNYNISFNSQLSYEFI